MTADDDSNDHIYHPPLAPEPVAEVKDVPDAEASGAVRRSRVLVVTVVVASATMLLGAIAAIVLLSTGLVTALGDRATEVEIPGVQFVEQAPQQPAIGQEVIVPYAPPVPRAGCAKLCVLMTADMGSTVGDWQQQMVWADATPEQGASAAAAAEFVRDGVPASITVFQFDDDAAASAAAVAMRERLGQPVFESTVFKDGTGTRYDFSNHEVSSVLWHLDPASEEHVPGRLYLVQAPTHETTDFSTQSAFLLYLALPL